MSFIQSGSETGIYRILGDNKLDGIYIGQLLQHNSLHLLMMTQNFFTQFSNVCCPKLYIKQSKPPKLLTKSKARSLKTSLQLRTLKLSSNLLKQLFYSYTCEKTCLAFHIFLAVFVNLLTEKLWIQRHEILCLLEIETRPLFFPCIR